MPEDKIILNREKFPGNAHKELAKTERPKKKPIAKAKRVKKPFHKRFANAFLAGEPAHEVGEYVIYDVVIPAAKSTLADLIEGAIDLLLFGGTGSRSSRYRSPHVVRDRGRSFVPYNSMHDRNVGVQGSRGRSSRASVGEPNRLRGNDVSDIVFPSRAEAEAVLGELVDSIEKYGAVSLGDFLDLAGISSPYTANKWGWVDIEGVAIIRVREGWILDLPQPGVIN